MCILIFSQRNASTSALVFDCSCLVKSAFVFWSVPRGTPARSVLVFDCSCLVKSVFVFWSVPRGTPARRALVFDCVESVFVCSSVPRGTPAKGALVCLLVSVDRSKCSEINLHRRRGKGMASKQHQQVWGSSLAVITRKRKHFSAAVLPVTASMTRPLPVF